MMLETVVYDEKNPIWDWMDKCMSDVGPSWDDIYMSLRQKKGKNNNGKRVRVNEEIEFEETKHENEDELEVAF
ncbi:hypothetical protein ACP70R_031595 [Stipagrostis hirtigluma subsp. patula]